MSIFPEPNTLASIIRLISWVTSPWRLPTKPTTTTPFCWDGVGVGDGDGDSEGSGGVGGGGEGGGGFGTGGRIRTLIDFWGLGLGFGESMDGI